MQLVTFSHARANFAKIWDSVVDQRTPITLTRRGSENVTLLTESDYRSLIETLHLLSTPANARRLYDALAEADRGGGRVQTPADLRRELGLHTDE